MSSDTASAGRSSVGRSSAIMAAGTLTSRVLGLLRAALLAAVIGTTGLTADAFGVANTLPNQFYLILAGGILNAVLVPQIVRASTHADGGQDFLNRLITLSLSLLTAATAITVAGASVLIWLFADFQDPSALRLATLFAYICLPQVFFYGLYTVFGQILNANNRFGAYMWAPVAANLVALLGLLAFHLSGSPKLAAPEQWTPMMIWILAGSSTLSIAIQAFCLLIPLRRMGFRYRPRWGFRGVGLGSASTVALWTFGAVIVAQLGFVVTSRALTQATDQAKVQGLIGPGRAAFDSAFLFFMLPHSLITVSLVTALFTRMAGSVRDQRLDDLRADLIRALRAPAAILIPGVIFGITFGHVLTRAFFFGNDLASTNAVGDVMVALFFGVIPFGWLYTSERFFYAHADARTPFGIQVVVTSLATTGSVIASRLSPEITGPFIGAGQSVAYLVGATIGCLLIRRKLGALGLGSVLSTYVRIGAPALVIAAVLYAVVHLTLPDLLERGPLWCAAVAALAGAVQLIGSLAAAAALGVTEVKDLTAPVLGRLRRR